MMKRMKMPKVLMALTVMMTLTACDYAEKVDLRREREDATYRKAMAEYRAGNLGAAVAGLKKVCAADPANSSARFQLACLLQDAEKDYLGAFCGYREYLLQCPESDKSALATSRLAVCERELAGVLASKFGLNAVAEGEAALGESRAALAKAEARNKKLTEDLEASMRRVAALVRENAQLKKLMSTESTETDVGTAPTDEISAAKELIAEDEKQEPASTPAAEIATAKTLLEDGGSYVVQEGDTLYKIALKFYGRSSGWSKIREANKSIISSDGRVRVGQRIVIPAE